MICMVVNKKEEKLMEEETFDLDLEEIEMMLSQELEASFSDLHFLEKERAKISNPDALGEVIQSAVWEQFMNQIAVIAGEDFIKENNNLTLDLRNDAHIQTAENFEKGKIATHNYISKEQLETNYDRYTNTPHKVFRKKYVNPGMDKNLKRAGRLNKEGVQTVKDIYTGRQISTKTKFENGKNNPKAAQREHVKPSAELYSNPSLQMANSDQELADIINSPENLQGYTTAERNNRKSDYSAHEMNEKDKTQHWKNANDKADGFTEQKTQKGEERLRKEGKKTQREETLRIGGKALRAVVMQLLADLMKEMVSKLVKWFKATDKSLNSLLESIKEAIHSFVGNLKTHLINVGNTLSTTIATAIYGPIIQTIRKIFTLLNLGRKSLRDAIAYIKDPNNKGKSLNHLMLEVGKIVTASLIAGGAIVLGEVIEKKLVTIPVFSTPIPLIGSLASVLGIFLGALTSGIIGAIILRQIDKLIAKRLKEDVSNKLIVKKNEILEKQSDLNMVVEQRVANRKEEALYAIIENHAVAEKTIEQSLEKIHQEIIAVHSKEEQQILTDEFDIMRKELDELL